jgi:hypothetical protein
MKALRILALAASTLGMAGATMPAASAATAPSIVPPGTNVELIAGPTGTHVTGVAALGQAELVRPVIDHDPLAVDEIARLAAGAGLSPVIHWQVCATAPLRCADTRNLSHETLGVPGHLGWVSIPVAQDAAPLLRLSVVLRDGPPGRHGATLLGPLTAVIPVMPAITGVPCNWRSCPPPPTVFTPAVPVTA